MSTDDEEEALNLHNVYRSSFQWELTQDYLNQTYPTAKNMYVLVSFLKLFTQVHIDGAEGEPRVILLYIYYPPYGEKTKQLSR